MSPEIEGDAASDGLHGRVVRGVGWILSGQIVMRIVALATTLVLARLLTPADIGLATEAIVFSRFTFLLTDVGLFAVVVQRKRLSDEDRQTAFWTSAALGAVLALLLFGLAGPIARLYHEPRAESLVRVLSLSVFFTSLGLTPGALLTRELRFRSIQLRTIVATVAAAATAIVVAALGYGPWALIAQSLAITGGTTALTWLLMSWRPRLIFSTKSLRQFAGFSSYVFGGDLLQYLSRNADNFLVGRFLGAARLGAYSLAYSVMLAPMQTLAGPVQNVIFPAMSRIRDPRRVGEIWIRASVLVAAAAVPTYLGLMVVAPDLVPVVFGKRWHETIPVLQILTYVGLLQSWGALRGSVLLALGRASLVFRLQALGSTMAVLSFIVGLHWGIVGVAAAYSVSSTLVNVYGMVVTGRVTGVTIFGFARRMAGVIQAGGAMALVVLGTRLLLIDEGVHGGARLAILIVLGAVVYVPICIWRAPDVLTELRDGWQRLRRKAEPATDGMAAESL